MPRTVTAEEPDYEEELRIDPDALDVEWLEQPMVFMRWSQKSADARAAVDRAKMNLDVVEAEVASDVRLNPTKYGLEKITEAAIRSAVLRSEEYVNATNVFIAFKHESDILGAAVRSFDQRKVALENLVKLQQQSYFAGPKEPRNLGEEFDKREGARRIVRERIKERRERRRDK